MKYDKMTVKTGDEYARAVTTAVLLVWISK
jgi:hypothetical protein